MKKETKSTLYKHKEPALPSDATLSSCLELIAEAAKHSKLCQELFDNYSQHIAYVGGRLGLADDAVVLLAMFINRAYDYSIAVDDIMEDLDCTYLTIVKHFTAIQQLRAAKYINGQLENDDSDDITFSVPCAAVMSISKNRPYVDDLSGLNQITMFERIKKLFYYNKNGKLNHSEFVVSIIDLFSHNPKLELVEAFEKWRLGIKSKDIVGIAFLGFCYFTLYENYDGDGIGMGLMRQNDNAYFIKDYPDWRKATRALLSKGLIQHAFSDGMADANHFCLTSKARTEFLAGTEAAESKITGHTIKAADIAEKDLFYNGKEAADIERLYSLIAPERFGQVQQTLASRGMRTGFACMFYGSPGTGKTETVLQLARRTGRDIMQVNVTDIRSKWVGDSERNIKEAFDQYNALCESCEVVPILLFNEADAVLGARIKGAQNGVDRMENSVQNIILQEMEKLKGIMIATSNLNENFDPAFERRFLYKIEFMRPSSYVRRNIWRSMITDLTDEEARTLAGRYDFSGGEIENVTRKLLVEQLLAVGTTKTTMQLVTEICDSEGANTIKRAVGF